MRERVLTARNGVAERFGHVLDEKDAKDFERIAGKILEAFAENRG